MNIVILLLTSFLQHSFIIARITAVQHTSVLSVLILFSAQRKATCNDVCVLHFFSLLRTHLQCSKNGEAQIARKIRTNSENFEAEMNFFFKWKKEKIAK